MPQSSPLFRFEKPDDRKLSGDDGCPAHRLRLKLVGRWSFRHGFLSAFWISTEGWAAPSAASASPSAVQEPKSRSEQRRARRSRVPKEIGGEIMSLPCNAISVLAATMPSQ